MPHCGTCKHWTPPKPRTTDTHERHHGSCERIGNVAIHNDPAAGLAAFIPADFDDMPLKCTQNFGCNLHEFPRNPAVVSRR